VFPARSVKVTFTGKSVGTGVMLILKLPLPFTAPVHTTAPLAFVTVTTDQTSQLPVSGLKFVGRFNVGSDGAVVSISPVVTVPVEVFPAVSVVVIITGHVVGIGLGVILKVPLPLTVQVPITAHVLLYIVTVVHTSHVPVRGLKFVGVVNVGTVGGVLSITSVGAVDPVEVLPASSVILIALLVPSKSPHVAVAVQATAPLAVTGEGIQFIQGTETVDPVSAHVRESVTVSPLITGFGESVPIFGSLGVSVSFTIDALIAAEVFPTGSVAEVCNDIVPSGYPERSILVDHVDHVAVTVPSTTQLDVVIVIISPDPVHQPLTVTDDSSDSLNTSSHISGESTLTGGAVISI